MKYFITLVPHPANIKIVMLTLLLSELRCSSVEYAQYSPSSRLVRQQYRLT